MTDTTSLDSFRPETWGDFVGQDTLKDGLEIRIDAALAQGQPLPHVLLTGPSGFGKTTVARLISAYLSEPLVEVCMPVKPLVFASVLRRFPGGVLFLDEIHRLTKSQQEDLLTLLSENYFQLSNGRKVRVGWLTVVAATTEPENVTKALFNRFPIRPDFDAYTPGEMQEIVVRMAQRKSMTLSDDVVEAIAGAAAGTPRNAGSLILAAEALASTGREVNVENVLWLGQVDSTGLTKTHLTYLEILRSLGGQAGLELVANMLRLHPSVIKDVERLLVEQGLIMYGERGRELTGDGWNYGKPQNISPRRPR